MREGVVLALGVDVLAPEGYGEVIGGGQREDDPDVLAGRTAKAQTAFANRRGRQSTQLAMGDDTTYRRTTLG